MQASAAQTDRSAVPPGWDCHVHVFSPTAPVAPGHYRPQVAALETIETLAAGCGVGHLVLVQPSVYGTDNRLMLQMLGRQPGRHRGVAVLDASAASSSVFICHCQPAHYEQRCTISENAIARSISNHSRRRTPSWPVT